jgi:hypothetical protein
MKEELISWTESTEPKTKIIQNLLLITAAAAMIGLWYKKIQDTNKSYRTKYEQFENGWKLECLWLTRYTVTQVDGVLVWVMNPWSDNIRLADCD